MKLSRIRRLERFPLVILALSGCGVSHPTGEVAVDVLSAFITHPSESDRLVRATWEDIWLLEF